MKGILIFEDSRLGETSRRVCNDDSFSLGFDVDVGLLQCSSGIKRHRYS
jgi:hypothetical protein